MKKTNDADNKKLQAMLGNLGLPEVQMSAHQRQLRETLLASSYFKKGAAHLSTLQKIRGGITQMKPKVWKLVASLAVLFLALGVYMAFFVTPQAVASLTLQVNPAVTLTLSEEHTVIDAEGLDAQGEALLTGLDVTGKEVQEALRIIAGALREAGLLGPNQQVVVALHTIEGRLLQPELTTLADNVRQALLGYMTEQGLPVEVKVAVVTAELVDVARAIGLLPIDYVDFVAEVGYPLAKEALKLQEGLGLDPALFKEELGTIGAALVDMTEAGITAADALAILEKALAADPTLEELSTITAAMIDLHEAGATQEEMMSVFALVEEQLAAGIERALLLEEFTTITAAKIDLLEAGIPAAAALAVLQTAMAADPKLEELTTITAAMIDLTEEGLSKEEALAKIQAAIKADPTLQNFDYLLEVPGKEEEEADEAAEPGEPQPGKPQPDKPEPDKPQPDKPEAEAPGEGVDGAETGKPQPGKPYVPASILGNETDEE